MTLYYTYSYRCFLPKIWATVGLTHMSLPLDGAFWPQEGEGNSSKERQENHECWDHLEHGHSGYSCQCHTMHASTFKVLIGFSWQFCMFYSASLLWVTIEGHPAWGFFWPTNYTKKSKRKKSLKIKPSPTKRTKQNIISRWTDSDFVFHQWEEKNWEKSRNQKLVLKRVLMPI